MLYLLTILLGNFDQSLFKSIYIFLISFFSNTFSAISGGGAGLLQLTALILSGVPYYQENYQEFYAYTRCNLP